MQPENLLDIIDWESQRAAELREIPDDITPKEAAELTLIMGMVTNHIPPKKIIDEILKMDIARLFEVV